MQKRQTRNDGLLLGLALALVPVAPACTPAPVVRADRSDLPLAGVTADELERFRRGDALFEATLREADGLGPLYVRASCSACHRADARGPGLVGKMAVVEPDGVTAAADQSLLRFGPTERPYAAAGASHPLLAPGAGAGRVRVTHRLPPAVFGRGYLEAVAASAIEALARDAATRTGSIRGRLPRLPGGAIGRFGLKARIATLEDFAADAFNSDMGITSPSRPDEPPNPDGQRDDDKPGVDVTPDVVAATADYVRLLALPPRSAPASRGREAFTTALCDTCHVPSVKTDPGYRVPALAGIDAPVFTDFLLHDMGPALADGVAEGAAREREWRTAPLIGLRFFSAYLHDGRARTIEEAIAAHGGAGSEAADAIRRFDALAAGDRRALVEFVASL